MQWLFLWFGVRRPIYLRDGLSESESSLSPRLWSFRFPNRFPSLSLSPSNFFFLKKAESQVPNTEALRLEMGTCYGYSISTLSSLCVASIVVVFMLLEHFGALMNISGSKSEFSIPMVELQKKITGDDQVRVLRTAGSDTGFDVNRLGNRAVCFIRSLFSYLFISLTHIHTSVII